VPAGDRWSEISGYTGDIRALGTTIFYALGGKIPEQIHSKIDSESAYNPLSDNWAIDNIRPELADVLNKMIGNRYHSTAEVLAELDFNRNVVTFPPPMFDNLVLAKSKSKQATSNNRRATNRSEMVQKIIWSLLTLPFIVALGIIFIGINKNYYRSFENYLNDDYEFSIEYPQDWSYQELNDPITGAIVVFTSPLETDADIFQEKVYLGIEYLSTSTTNLNQYTQTVFDRIKQAKGSDIEIQEDFKTTIDKSPARVIIYSREESGLKLRQMEAFTIKNNRVYIAIYMAEEKEFAKFLKIARKIIDSWEIQ
jgi:serine/threonine-protein kinase